MKIFRHNNSLVVLTDSGNKYTSNECTDSMWEAIINSDMSDDAIESIIDPVKYSKKHLVDDLSNSSILTRRGNSVYMLDVSELTLPQDLVEAILEAERNNDVDKVTAYRNFWTLVSLNPDSRVRNNLFWFLKRWGMCISKSGLIVGYRNADIKHKGTKYSQEDQATISREYAYIKYKLKKSPKNYTVKRVDGVLEVYAGEATFIDGTTIGNLEWVYNDMVECDGKDCTVYTDHHSHTFSIRLGHIVSMPREQVDENQEHTCSRGLHVANKGWLKQNYFGEVGLRVLVNPADVCGIPTLDNYGKMRVCAYYPVNVVNYDTYGDIIDEGIESGFEDDFINKICYTGEINNEDNDNYTLNIPAINEVDVEQMYRNLKNIAEQIRRDKCC